MTRRIRAHSFLRRSAVQLAEVMLAVMACARVAHAHPIHTTFTNATADEHTLTLNVRAFADDFSATVAKFAGRPAPADSSAPVADVLRYMRSYFSVFDAAGRAIALESCGVRRANELYWLCLRASFPAGSKGARLRNGMLTELHPDQVNIVKLERGSTQKTMLFTKGSAPALIGS